MTAVELIGVPFDGLGRAGGQRSAPHALREEGLGDPPVPGTIVRPDLDLPDSVAARGAHGLLNESALVAMVEAVSGAVGDAHRRGVVPVLYGGDCASLLGSVPVAARTASPLGLVCIDAHEDATPPEASASGEAANMEIGILAGLSSHSLPAGVEDALGTVPGRRVALLGIRDAPWRGDVIPTVRDRVGLHLTVDEVARAPVDAGRRAADQVGPELWLHVDVDVLSRAAFGSYGDPDELQLDGGLTWAQLSACAEQVIGGGSCVGMSVGVYNPDLDLTREDGRALVDFLRNACSLLTT